MSYIKYFLISLIFASTALHAMKKDRQELPLLRAAQTGDLKKIKSLLDAGADPNQTQEEMITPLMLAANAGNEDIVRELLDHGALVDQKDREGRTALMQATSKNQTDVAKYLLKKKASIILLDQNGDSVLQLAYHSKPRMAAGCFDLFFKYMLKLPNETVQDQVITIILCCKKIGLSKDIGRIITRHLVQSILVKEPEKSIAFQEVRKLPIGLIKTVLIEEHFPQAYRQESIEELYRRNFCKFYWIWGRKNPGAYRLIMASGALILFLFYGTLYCYMKPV